MKVFFVTAVTDLNIAEPLGRGDRLDDSTYITNNFSAFEKYMTPVFVAVTGRLDSDFIRKSRTAIFGVEELPEEANIQEYLVAKMVKLSTLLRSLWLIKDNSVNHDVVFAAYTRSGVDHVDSNHWRTRTSAASGQHSSVTFTRKELAQARRLFRERFEPAGVVKAGSASTIQVVGRFERVFYFIDGARKEADLSLKITNYCSALESAFATQSAELTHVLSERVAVFLEDHPGPRLELYRDIKKAYGIRSVVVHGGGHKPSKLDDLLSSSIKLDDVLRRVVMALLSSPIQRILLDLPGDELDEYMLRRIFGASWEDFVERETNSQDD